MYTIAGDDAAETSANILRELGAIVRRAGAPALLLELHGLACEPDDVSPQAQVASQLTLELTAVSVHGFDTILARHEIQRSTSSAQKAI
jgi:hypothetical protein